MGIEFDFTELDRLAADLGKVPTQTRQNVRKAVEVTARGIKDDWRGFAKGPSGRHARAYPSSIDYDIDGVGSGNTSGEIAAEIGPNLGRKQGALGFLEEGVDQTPGQNAIPVVVRANEPDFIRGVLRAATDPLEK